MGCGEGEGEWHRDGKADGSKDMENCKKALIHKSRNATPGTLVVTFLAESLKGTINRYTSVYHLLIVTQKHRTFYSTPISNVQIVHTIITRVGLSA